VIADPIVRNLATIGGRSRRTVKSPGSAPEGLQRLAQGFIPGWLRGVFAPYPGLKPWAMGSGPSGAKKKILDAGRRLDLLRAPDQRFGRGADLRVDGVEASLLDGFADAGQGLDAVAGVYARRIEKVAIPGSSRQPCRLEERSLGVDQRPAEPRIGSGPFRSAGPQSSAGGRRSPAGRSSGRAPASGAAAARRGAGCQR